MGKLSDNLNRQLTTEFKEDAEACIKIHAKLKELNDGSVWSSQWNVLTDVRFIGQIGKSTRIYSPSEIGKIFINGLK